MGNSGTGSQPNQQDLTRFWQALMTAFYRRSTIMAAKWQQGGADSAAVADLLENHSQVATPAAEGPQPAACEFEQVAKFWELWRVSTIVG